MTRNRRSRRIEFRLEGLETRLALSGLGGGLDDATTGHHGAEVRSLRHGADDAPGHDANDDHPAAPGRGADDGANHDANDNRGAGEAVHRHRRRGRVEVRRAADDGPNHHLTGKHGAAGEAVHHRRG